MKIVTWNIPYSFRTDTHAEAWEYLLSELPADYYLLQEVSPPDWADDDCNYVWSEIGGKRNWGSAVVSPHHDLERRSIESELEGAFVVADSEFKGIRDVTMISLYGLFERIGTAEYATPNLHRMLSDLTGVLGGRDPDQTHNRILLGGDLNASLQYDKSTNNSRIVFDRLKNFGMVDSFERFYEDYVRTYRHGTRPLQNDYIFVSEQLSSDLESCEVIENDAVRKYSDHNPVIVTLDID